MFQQRTKDFFKTKKQTTNAHPMKPLFIEIPNFWADNLGR